MVLPEQDPLHGTVAATERAGLDDLASIERLDGEGVLDAIERFGEQCRAAWTIGLSATGLPDATDVSSVVVLGMGGSGVSGDVVASVVEPRLPLPLRTVKGYGPLPGWVGRNTLVFAVSHSGSTEETISAFKEAQERGARSVAISSGGPLAELALESGVVHLAIPGGLPPRASLGYLALPILAVLEKVELIPSLGQDVDEAVEIIEELSSACFRTVPADRNPAKDLASRIVGRIPFVYGQEGPTAVAAYRFKCDLNEYGKTPASWHFFPELDHNEIAGWNRLADLTTSNCVAILLRDTEEHPRNALRVAITERLIRQNVAEVIHVHARGRSALARALSLITLTQLASIYVGLAYGVDPGPVEVLQELKNELARVEE